MKTRVIITVCVLMATVSFAQNQKINEVEVEVTAAKFQSELYQSVNDLLNNNLEYPIVAIDRNIQGTEIIKFLVTTEGKLTDFKIVNSLGREIDREVLRVLRSTNGKWIPGSIDGIHENMEKEISVSFYLGPDEFVVSEANSLLHKGNKWMFTKNNPRKAIYYLNKGVKLLPYDAALLEARALCRYKLGDKRGSEQDRLRLTELAQRNESKNGNTHTNYSFEAIVARMDSVHMYKAPK